MARPMAGSRSAGALANEPFASASKLTMIQSPMVKGGLNSEAVSATGSRPGLLNSLGGPGGAKSSAAQKGSQSASHLDVAEVRALTNDKPYSENQDSSVTTRSELGTLMSRLKSREARAKAESNREFLARYRTSGVPDPKNDEKLDNLLASTAARADELRVKSEELQLEAADAERKLERTNSQSVNRAHDQELQAMNAFERSQRRIQEDKREEELQKLRDEAQANYVRVHRRLQNELIELRDYKVLLAEFRRLRLEKLQENLSRVQDGRKLRGCVRHMIRHGAQRILGRLEQAGVPLEVWMREVLVNSCHLELRIQDAQSQLLTLQRQALVDKRKEVQEMANASKEDRFEALCARTWDNRRKLNGVDEPVVSRETTIKFSSTIEGEDAVRPRRASLGGGPNASLRGLTSLAKAPQSVTRVPSDIAAEMQAVEADVAAVKRLLDDMRANAASVVCHQIREAEKTGGFVSAKEAMQEGFRKLKLLVNEDFAKITMKELQKSAPQGKFVL